MRDEYGFEFFLFHPSKIDLEQLGNKITCRVDSVLNDGLVLSSTTGDAIPDEDAWLEKEILFDKLHDARVDAFKVLNDRDFRGVWMSIWKRSASAALKITALLILHISVR